MASYLVIGGAGFIGCNLVDELLRRGERVRVLDNLATGQYANLLPFLDQIEFIQGDICEYATVREAVQGIDFVLHQGALPSVPRSVAEPILTSNVNVMGTLNVLQAARDAGVKRLVYASSSSVYGNREQLPKIETMCPNPLSPYAIAKLASEQYCQIFWRLYGFETVSLRYFNVFGPRQDPTSQYSAVIPRFIDKILQGEPVTIHGDGTQSRDFTYIQNVVHANLVACTAPNAGGVVVNIACGQRYTLRTLVETLEALLQRKANIEYVEPRVGDVQHSQADIQRAQEVLGYEPQVTFEEGLQKTVAWYISQKSVQQS